MNSLNFIAPSSR